MVDGHPELRRAGLAVAAAARAPAVVLLREEHLDERTAPLVEAGLSERFRDGLMGRHAARSVAEGGAELGILDGMKSLRRTTAGEFLGNIPPVTLTIMLICLAAWLIAVPTSSWSGWSWLELSADNLRRGRVWTLITYQFMHAPTSPFHFFFNMLNLWYFGRGVERRWPAVEYLAFYLACGVAGGVAYGLIALILGSSAPVIGASGAVLGVLVAYAMIWPYQVIAIFGLIQMQVRHLVLLIVFIDFLISWVGVAGVGSPVGTVAHLGGAAFAWVYMKRHWQLTTFPETLFSRARNAWRRRNLAGVEKDWDRLMREDDDDKSH